MLTAAEIAGMRAAVDDALPETALIMRNTPAPDGGGGSTASWSQIASVACRRWPHAGGEGPGDAGGRVVDVTTHIVTLPAGTDITEADQIIIGGVTYDVTVLHTRGAWELNRRVEVREIK